METTINNFTMIVLFKLKLNYEILYCHADMIKLLLELRGNSFNLI